MIEMLLDGLSWALFIVGAVLIVGGALGLIRFPDFYTRIHAAGVTDTMGADLLLLGMALQADNWMVFAKLILLFFFLVLTSPVSTHAVAHAAWVGGLAPRTGKDLRHDAEVVEEAAREETSTEAPT